MKNLDKFMQAKFHTLTDAEWDELTNLVNKICDAHEGDKWWKVDCCIKTCIDFALSAKQANEEVSQFCEEIV